jgi:hypothetical protein
VRTIVAENIVVIIHVEPDRRRIVRTLNARKVELGLA